MNIATILKIIDEAAEQWKMEMLTHIEDYGVDTTDMPYVTCFVDGIRWYLDLDGIYAKSNENGNELSD